MATESPKQSFNMFADILNVVGPMIFIKELYDIAYAFEKDRIFSILVESIAQLIDSDKII